MRCVFYCLYFQLAALNVLVGLYNTEVVALTLFKWITVRATNCISYGC